MFPCIGNNAWKTDLSFADNLNSTSTVYAKSFGTGTGQTKL